MVSTVLMILAKAITKINRKKKELKGRVSLLLVERTVNGVVKSFFFFSDGQQTRPCDFIWSANSFALAGWPKRQQSFARLCWLLRARNEISDLAKHQQSETGAEKKRRCFGLPALERSAHKTPVWYVVSLSLLEGF